MFEIGIPYRTLRADKLDFTWQSSFKFKLSQKHMKSFIYLNRFIIGNVSWNVFPLPVAILNIKLVISTERLKTGNNKAPERVYIPDCIYSLIEYIKCTVILRPITIGYWAKAMNVQIVRQNQP
jgi:hypothetical protein